MQGGFCICLIRIISDDGTISLLRGASRRSYKDRQNRVSGEIKAFVRALKYSRPIVIGQMDQVQVTGTVKWVNEGLDQAVHEDGL
jgi:hypothetical protein